MPDLNTSSNIRIFSMQTHTETLYDAMFRAANHYSVQGTEEGLSVIFNSSAAEWKRSIAVPRRMPRH